MPVFIGFLRGINLGKHHQFSPKQIVAACEGAGFTEVATHINSGNVRVRTALRSRAKVEQALERAFRADRDFEVPTIVLTPAEVRAVVADADEIGSGHARHYVSLCKTAPTATAGQALTDTARDGERAEVRGRVVHLLLDQGYHQAKLTNAVVEKHLGCSTNRNVTVLRAIADKWCRGWAWVGARHPWKPLGSPDSGSTGMKAEAFPGMPTDIAPGIPREIRHPRNRLFAGF